MTHYTVRFADFPEAIRPLKALQEIISYMGEERFTRITEAAITDIKSGMTLDSFCFQVSFAGISGYPARIWYDYCTVGWDEIAIPETETAKA